MPAPVGTCTGNCTGAYATVVPSGLAAGTGRALLARVKSTCVAALHA
jgi:hypothetical protein